MTFTRTIDVKERAAFWASLDRKILSPKEYDLHDVDDEIEEISRAYLEAVADLEASDRRDAERREAWRAVNIDRLLLETRIADLERQLAAVQADANRALESYRAGKAE